MRLVHMRDGALEIRWTWLPFWLATNPKLTAVVEAGMRDAVLLGAVTPSAEDLDRLHNYVARRLQELFPAFPGLAVYLDSLKTVEEPPEPG